MRWLRYWLPVLFWAAVISGASTARFSSENTSRYIVPFLHWLFPSLGSPELLEIHHLIRKGGHVFEYAVFSLILFYAIRAGRAGWRWSWAAITIFVVACYAALDEIHQIFVPGRGASAKDSLLDTVAGAGALLIAWAISQQMERRRQAREVAKA
jgi:VanZ family protein